MICSRAEPPAVAGGAAVATTARRRGSFLCGGWMPFARGIGARSGALFLIGLGILFFTGNFWPWILAVAGVAGAAEELGGGDVREAPMTLVFMVGMAVLFATGAFWPGFLVLIGIIALLDRT